MSAWRQGAWRTGAWRVGSWRGMEAGVGTVVTFFNRISKARTKRITKLNYTLIPVGDGTYNVIVSSGVSQDIVGSPVYRGYEFP
jgi:hypothetical protein